MQALNRCATGTSDHIFESPRVHSRIDDHFRAPKDSLGRQLSGDIARQPSRNAAIATAEKGAKTAEHQADGFIALLRDMTGFSLNRLYADAAAVR